mmetsp:Transcript_18364/g.69519  ORF Transcript_18364/g.69519 Transcript_18364/m.69519 type:complete len:308 (+) Transcript_18364:601-1524(+)
MMQLCLLLLLLLLTLVASFSRRWHPQGPRRKRLHGAGTGRTGGARGRPGRRHGDVKLAPASTPGRSRFCWAEERNTGRALRACGRSKWQSRCDRRVRDRVELLAEALQLCQQALHAGAATAACRLGDLPSRRRCGCGQSPSCSDGCRVPRRVGCPGPVAGLPVGLCERRGGDEGSLRPQVRAALHRAWPAQGWPGACRTSWRLRRRGSACGRCCRLPVAQPRERALRLALCPQSSELQCELAALPGRPAAGGRRCALRGAASCCTGCRLGRCCCCCGCLRERGAALQARCSGRGCCCCWRWWFCYRC